MASNIVLAELPPSIFIAYKNTEVLKVQAYEHCFVVTTKQGREKWVRSGGKWVKETR